jgi:3-methyladenine DNA glycosylase AlkD
MEYEEIIKKLESLKNPKNVDGMARFGIRPKVKVFGVPVPEIRKIAKEIKKSMGSRASHRLAKEIKKDHQLALKLFDSGIHEARLLATMIADVEKLTGGQIEKWIKTFDSWDIVDQACMNLLCKSDIAKKKILDFSKRKKEFEKRTAFALMASLAVHDKKMMDKDFIKFFSLIKKASVDERNFVKKAVNWALRQIGKRNKKLNIEATKLALQLRLKQAKSEKWIGNDAYRELTSKSVQDKIKNKKINDKDF